MATKTTWDAVTAPVLDKPYGYVDLGVHDIADKPVVVINAYRPFWLAFYPFHLLQMGQSLPASLRVLSRVSEHELILKADPVFQLDAEPITPLSGRATDNFAYLVRELMGLARSSEDHWEIGSTYLFPEMRITVDSLYKGKPDRLTIRLLHYQLSDYRWSYWNKQSRRYEALRLPEAGQSIHIEGMMDKAGYFYSK